MQKSNCLGDLFRAFLSEKENTYYPEECPCCEEFKTTVSTRRRNTRYLDQKLNFFHSCEECFESDWKYHDELLKDYYASVL